MRYHTAPSHPVARFVEVRPTADGKAVWLLVAEEGLPGETGSAGVILTPDEANEIARNLAAVAAELRATDPVAAVVEALPYFGAGRSEAEALIDALADAGWRLVQDGG